jgi:hypothetical protein
MKQTAVNWLIEQLNLIEWIEDDGLPHIHLKIVEEAKEMEKQQIMDAVEYHIDLLNQTEISNNEIKLASIERLKIRLESSENIQIASADALGFFIGAEWYREQLKQRQ